MFQDWLRACRRHDWSQITLALLVGQTLGSTSWREVRSWFDLSLYGFFNDTVQLDPLVDRVSWPPSAGGQSGFISPFLLGKPAFNFTLIRPSCWARLRAIFLLGLPSGRFLVWLPLASARPLFMVSVRHPTFLLVELRNARLLCKC